MLDTGKAPGNMIAVEFILYVHDQTRSRDFYAKLLDRQPSLDVPGMTEFELGASVKLGLMPEDGIAKIITPILQHPREAKGAPRCELYLLVTDARAWCDRALEAGATEVAALSPRDWGDLVGYFADLDGHVVAIAEKMQIV